MKKKLKSWFWTIEITKQQDFIKYGFDGDNKEGMECYGEAISDAKFRSAKSSDSVFYILEQFDD